MPLNIHDTFSLTHVGVCVCLSSFFFLFVCCLCVDVICTVLHVLVPVYSTVCALMSKHVFVCVVFVCVWVYAYVYVMSFSPDLQLTVCLLSQSV